jgi:hypothetical protein
MYPDECPNCAAAMDPHGNGVCPNCGLMADTLGPTDELTMDERAEDAERRLDAEKAGDL